MSRAGAYVDHAVLSGLNVLPLPNFSMMTAVGLVLLPFIKLERMIRMNATALRVPDTHYAGYRYAARQMSRRAYFRASGDAGRFRVPENSVSITCPTLLVAGEHEHRLIRQSLVTTQAALARAQARIVPGVGHGWSGERPELFAQTIRAWVTDSPLPAELQTVP